MDEIKVIRTVTPCKILLDRTATQKTYIFIIIAVRTNLTRFRVVWYVGTPVLEKHTASTFPADDCLPHRER
jgi:hypothetical protein